MKVGPDDNRAGVVGEYKSTPGRALQATFMLEKYLRDDPGFNVKH